METYSRTYRFHPARLARLTTVALVALSCAGFALAAPIHDAARKGDLNKVKALVAADPTSVSSRDKSGNTPLHMAAFHNQKAVAEFLLASGADVNSKNYFGSFGPGDLEGAFAANMSNHRDPIDLLQTPGIDSRAGTNGYTPLDMALFSYNHKDLVQLLLDKGADVNATAASGATPLFWTIMRGLNDDAKLLISKGANVNAKDAYGNSLLHCAVRMDHPIIAELLLTGGADANPKDQRGLTPFSYAVGGDDPKMTKVLRDHGAHE